MTEIVTALGDCLSHVTIFTMIVPRIFCALVSDRRA